MSKTKGMGLFLLFASAFLLLNRDAYQGYFQADEIGALDWTRWAPLSAYLKGAVSPVYTDNFRAVGFLYFHLLGPVFKLDFWKYVAVLHAIHLLNVWLLWLLLRRLGAGVLAACAGCAFYGLHMALFDAVWKPMYIFDVTCCMFCLLSLLLWIRGNWILSFVSFWLAFQSKEVAILLPVVIACYEAFFGGRRWLRLAPFAAACASFAVQALILHPAPGPYAHHFTPQALVATLPFYTERVFLVPYLGFLLPISEGFRRSRKTMFGLLMTTLLFVPLIFLPGRVFAAYCYVPFTGLAVTIAGIAEAARPAIVVLCLAACLPQNIHWLRLQRRDTLRQDAQIRAWMGTLRDFASGNPQVDGVVYQGLPEGFPAFGVSGAVHYILAAGTRVAAGNTAEGDKLSQSARVAYLRWDCESRRLAIDAP
jgi:hypothetical protein